jgi:nicotinate dehydrogenase subunit A
VIKLNVNGAEHQLDTDPTTPLLYVLRNELKLNGAKFGCGLGQCGACTVVVDDQPALSCITPISLLEGRAITTLEGLGTSEHPGVVQKAFIDEQAAQCGYQSPTDREIRDWMQPNLCRCGTHMRILGAIRRAAGRAS